MTIRLSESSLFFSSSIESAISIGWRRRHSTEQVRFGRRDAFMTIEYQFTFLDETDLD